MNEGHYDTDKLWTKKSKRKRVNPAHLFLATNAENSQDRNRKGRARGASGELNSHAKLTRKEAAYIRTYGNDGNADSDLATIYGVTREHIRKIRMGKRWEAGRIDI